VTGAKQETSVDCERLHDADDPGFVVHIPSEASDLSAAIALAELVIRSLHGFPQVEGGAATVSRQDHQSQRYGCATDC
jgi:hypothetical protein